MTRDKTQLTNARGLIAAGKPGGRDHISCVEEFVYERTVTADINKPKQMPGIFLGNQTFVVSGISHSIIFEEYSMDR